MTTQELIPHVAVDKENGRVFGPFPTYQAAVDWAVEVQYATGEWDRDAGMGRSNDYDDLNDAGWDISDLTTPPPASDFEEQA